MLYKFVGGPENALPDVFDKAVVQGSLKFASALTFNDPFEFKFQSLPPESRQSFNDWHRTNATERTAAELDNAWTSFEGGAADWNTTIVPRSTLLNQTFVLCLSRRWDSHLMWAHYGASFTGFVIAYQPQVVKALERLPGFLDQRDVTYADMPPEVRWFDRQSQEMAAAIPFTKAADWAYEREYRVILTGDPQQPALFPAIDPDLIQGVILGPRAHQGLIKSALHHRAARPGFAVEQISSRLDGYHMTAFRVQENVQLMLDML